MNTDACTLPTAERPLRLAELDALFTESVRGVRRGSGRAWLDLEGDEGLRDRVTDLTRRESACCSFFTFLMEVHGRDLTLEIRVPPEHEEILSALVARAERLSA